MKTVLLHQQHSKCLQTIELISKCDEYISNCRQNLEHHLSRHSFHPRQGVVEYNEKNIKKYKAIRQRLVLYYSNQFMKMIEPVADIMEQ